MICRRCGKNVINNSSTCPYCGSPVKTYKNKYVSSTSMKDTGGTVGESPIIQLKKVDKEKPIDRKDYNSYIDYKTAKEKKNKKYYNVYAKDVNVNNTGASKSNSNRSKYKKVGTVKESNKKDQEVVFDKKNVVNEKKTKQYSTIQEFGKNKKKQTIVVDEIEPKKSKKREPEKSVNFFRFSFALSVVVVLLYGSYYLTNNMKSNSYYFGEKTTIQNSNVNTTTVDDEMLQYQGVSKSGQTNVASSEGVTSIVYDNQYLEQMIFRDINDVNRLIVSDSNRQKDNCLPSIVRIENDIVSNYGITAVNFCEMTEDLALELKGVITYIYNNYPNARNYLTNITLANIEGATYIAAFMPVFTFGTSKTSNNYPIAVKSQIILNAKYFLNNSKLESSVAYSVKSGYFPPNATRSSTVAHEFGHYLSYVALINYYGTGKMIFVKASQANGLLEAYEDFDKGEFSYKMLREAYQRYKSMYDDGISFDDFRASISSYAMAKDKAGNYIYDETIAEAFHDCYLNGNDAQPASKVIVSILNSYL